jgi:hypothetical protein
MLCIQKQEAHDDLVYIFTKPWSDGTTGLTLSPWELLEKLPTQKCV